MSEVGGSLPSTIRRAGYRLPRRVKKACTLHPIELESATTTLGPRYLELQTSFEDRLYAAIAASAVIALLLGVLGLLNAPAAEKRSTVADKPGLIERVLPNQGKDGRF